MQVLNTAPNSQSLTSFGVQGGVQAPGIGPGCLGHSHLVVQLKVIACQIGQLRVLDDGFWHKARRRLQQVQGRAGDTFDDQRDGPKQSKAQAMMMQLLISTSAIATCTLLVCTHALSQAPTGAAAAARGKALGLKRVQRNSPLAGHAAAGLPFRMSSTCRDSTTAEAQPLVSDGLMGGLSALPRLPTGTHQHCWAFDQHHPSPEALDQQR